MKKLKIAMFMDSWYPDINGVILVMENLIKNMSEYADVTLVVPEMEKKYDDSKYPYRIIRVKSMPLIIAKYRLALVDLEYFKLKKIFEKEKFDIVHIHSPFAMGKLGVKVARNQGIPVVSTMHTRWEQEFKRYLKSGFLANLCVKHLIKTFNKCDNSIALNKALIGVYDNYGYTGEYTIIPNGTDMEMVKDKDRATKIVNKMFNLNKDDMMLLFVGRITTVKNVFFILDVLKELKNKNIKFKMVYVGDGPDFVNLKKKVKEAKLEKDVILAGKITDRELLKSIYYRANLFLFPSIYDSSSLVQIEAASQETPSVFIEGAVTADTATNNVNGFTARDDAKDYANKIEEIMNNKQLYETVKNNARRDLAKSWKDISKETYNYYLSMIEKNTKSA